MGSFIIYTLQIKKDKVDETCSMLGKDEKFMHRLVGRSEGKRLLVIDIDGRIILEWILKKYNGCGLIHQLRIGSSSRLMNTVMNLQVLLTA
jgi:hypothetical protein